MYWNYTAKAEGGSTLMINRNMRCIEISDCNRPSRIQELINRNMRCIEMGLSVFVVYKAAD